MNAEEPDGRFVIVDGGARALGDGRLTFGGSADWDVELAGAASATSFALSHDGSEWSLEKDDDGGQALYVNGAPFPGGKLALYDGDHVEIGFHDLVLAGDGDPRPGTAVLEPAGGGLVIGREPSCDLTVDSPAVARRHARIRGTADGLVVEDLGTRTGTRVNGARISRHALRAGDRVGIGGHRLVFDGRRLFCPGSTTPMRIDARNASFAVGEKVLLNGVSVTLEPGSLTAIIGESGSGKSTLMKALSGHQPPTSGTVKLNGEAVSETRPDMAMVPQADLVHSGLSVSEALMDAAQLRLPPDSTSEELTQAARNVIDELGISEQEAVMFEDLSGGQKKRVSVGVELVSEPGVLFLDEPTTGLDPGKEATVMGMLRELTDAGRTVALVTHATASLPLCDALIVIGEGGLLCFHGTPAEALEFFGVSSFPDIYGALEGHAPEWAGAYAAIAEPPGDGPDLPAPVIRRPPRFRDYARDFRVLTRRQWRLLVRDRRNLVIVGVQAPGLGVLAGLLMKEDVFAPGAPPDKAVQLLFVVVMISLWLGSIGSCRELVKEKSIVARERAAGVSVVPYLGSKLAFQYVLCCLQVVVLLAIVFVLQPLDQSLGNWLQLAAVFAAISFAAVTLGLAISAMSVTESQAISIVPLALIPQLLFAGSLIPPSQMSLGIELISRLAASQWGLRGAGAAIDIQARFQVFPAGPETSGWTDGFFEIGAGAAIAALLALSAVQLVLMFVGLVRSLSGR